MKHILFFIAIGILLFNQTISGQADTDIVFSYLGQIQPRSSNDIYSNNWSIGAETMDRDLVNFNSWKDHIAATGAKKVRLQAGWAKCEKVKGVYDFEWLDEVVDFLISQNIEPWLQASYGNPIYEGGGGIHLSAGLPTSDIALKAWDNWVRTLANRYKNRVQIWEIWNEPDNKKNNRPVDYASFYIRTAEIIRSEIPSSTLYALSLTRVSESGQHYTDRFLKTLSGQNKLDLISEITLHGYTYNPSDVYPDYEKIQRIIMNYSSRIKLRQGELGCPSENQPIMALRNYDWTELSQSKWVIRKMLGDLGRDIPSSYFLIIDIVYTHDHEKLMEIPKRNTKGLIKSDLNRQFVEFKKSYFAYQHVTSIFDDNLDRVINYPYTVDSDTSLSVFGYRSKHFDKQVVAIWMDSETPTNSNKKTSMSFEFPAGNFEIPVYVDLRTGNIYQIPKSDWKRKGSVYTFKNIPIYDSPILIAEKSLLKIKDKL
jgi:hypothetical protein